MFSMSKYLELLLHFYSKILCRTGIVIISSMGFKLEMKDNRNYNYRIIPLNAQFNISQSIVIENNNILRSASLQKPH